MHPVMSCGPPFAQSCRRKSIQLSHLLEVRIATTCVGTFLALRPLVTDRSTVGRYIMWIVRLALRRTYTFAVAALLIVVLGAVSINRMSTDVFPNVDTPVVSVVWSYTGMPADEVESRIVF